MKLEIQDAIQDLVTPETLKTITEVVQTLEEKDYVLALDELNQVLMLADSMADSSMLVGRINDVLHYALTYLLNDHGITVLQEASLETMHAIYQTVIYIPLYVIPEDLDHVFHGGYDNVELIAQLVPYFSNAQVDEILESLDGVTTACVEELHEIIKAKLTAQAEYAGGRVPAERIKLINRLLATNDRAKFSMMLELADAGVRIGRSYDELITMSFEGLESKNPVEAAAQMVGLAFYSDLPIEGVWRTIDVSLDEYTDNPMERRFMLDEIAEIKRNVGNLNEAT